jgi:hypothetical protein
MGQSWKVSMRTPSDSTMMAFYDHGTAIYAVMFVLSLISWAVIAA